KTLLNSSISDATSSKQSNNLDISTIISGLKEALKVGSERAVASVSQPNGYLKNADIRIPLPPQIEKVGMVMRQFGMEGLANEFETSMNRAAEKAAPQATTILVNAIKAMSIDDAKKILNGGDNAATQYFKQHTGEELRTLFKPTIEESLDQVGSTKYYNQLTDKVADVPVVGKEINMDLPDYVTEQALDGLFTMLAAEEKKIRENPTARTTELLKTVFQ
ncbi:DUF4197 domain-containing protein, partial [Methylophaga sp. UBA5088]